MTDSEVVVIFAKTRRAARGVADFAVVAAPSGESVQGVLDQFGASLAPVFDSAAVGEALPAGLAATEAKPSDPNLARFFRTVVPDEKAQALAEKLRELPNVEAAYVKPPAFNPLAPEPPRGAGFAAALSESPAVNAIPNYTAQQGYLAPAPGGIGAGTAWGFPGGRGKNVQVIDIEGDWKFTHVDLAGNLGLLGGTVYGTVSWRNHGTAVMGEVIGNNNSFGITGIASDAKMGCISHGTIGSAGAIQLATARLRPGDVMLLEMHRPGPRFNFQTQPDQRGYIAVEWWPDDFLAIKSAVAKGIIVVEAAGNGAENLNDTFYDTPGPGFPATWTNPFLRRDSGAIVVGAGAPPSGFFGPDRSRLDFSNHGKRVDCQGWGRGVVTAGYGDLHLGSGEQEWYTQQFSGTSSASPIVTGTVACMQGIARAKGKLLTPKIVRSMLRTTGSPQQAGPTAPVTQRIGRRPNLAQLVPLI